MYASSGGSVPRMIPYDSIVTQSVKSVLFVVPDFYPSVSGYGHACTEFVRALAAHTDLAVHVVTLAPIGAHPEIAVPRLAITRVRRPTIFTRSAVLIEEIRLFYAIRRAIQSLNPDVVVFETAEFPLAGLLTSLTRARRRLAVRIHATAETEWILFRRHPIYRAKRPLTRWFFRRVPAIFSTTRYYLGFVRRWFLDDDALLIASKYYGVIPNIARSVDSPAEPDGVPQEVLRELQSGRPVFLTLGRMDSHGELQKNFRRLLLSLAALRQRLPSADFTLLIVGRGDRKADVMHLAARLSLDDKVLFIETLPNTAIRYLQSRCHGVILASTFEGMSMFALESLASGAPLLVGASGGLTEMVDHGVTGVLFDPLSIDDMASKIGLFILEMAPRLETIRHAVRQKYETQFLPERIAGDFIQALEFFSAFAWRR